MTSEFISKRGLKIARSGKTVTDSLGGRHISLSDDEVDALREYFQHEEKLKAQPWLDAKPDEVWMLITANRRKALVWKDTGSTFTVVPPNGQSHIGVPDVIAELVEIGYTEFNSPDLKAVRLKEEE